MRSRYHPDDEPIIGYRLVEELGIGDLGEVWRAVGPEGRPVAVRVVELLTVESAEEVVRTLLFLKDHHHSNVAEIHGAWVKDENGALITPPHSMGSGDLISGTIAPSPQGLFIDASRSAGQIVATTDECQPAELLVATTLGEMTLRGRLEQRRQDGHTDIPASELLSYLADTVDALDYLAKHCNYRHHGIKPQSILIVGGRANVCDFGLLRLLESRSAASFGTQAYVAPELLEGHSPNERTDLFSLAVIYYEMSTGRLPFLETASAPRSAVSSARQSRSLRLEAIPSAHAQVLRRAMADNPSLRHATAREFIGELKKAVETAPRGSTARDSKGPPNYHEGDVPVPGYRLVRLLGKGSFGQVWRAEGPGGKSVALKISRFETDRSIADELRALLALKEFNHPNMAEIHGFWIKDENGEWVAPPERAGLDAFRETYMSGSNPSRKTTKGELFIAMTLGEKTLYDRLRQCKDEGRSGIPVDELLTYMADAADALDYLTRHYKLQLQHCDKPLQHCDIKPQNILIVAGHAKICDFGLLRMASNRPTQGMGSPAYSPPELLQGSGPNPQTDLYSLATSYYELRTGKLPFFEADTRSTTCVIDAKQSNRLRIEDVSPGEERVLRKAMDADPSKRYATSLEMVAALRRTATAKSGWDRTAVRLFSSAVVLGLVTVIAIVGYRYWDSVPRNVPDQTGAKPKNEQLKPAETGTQAKVAAAPTQSNTPKQSTAATKPSTAKQLNLEPKESGKSAPVDTVGVRLESLRERLANAEKQLDATGWEASESTFKDVAGRLDGMKLVELKDEEVARELKTRAALGLAQVIARGTKPNSTEFRGLLEALRENENRVTSGLRARFLLLNLRGLPQDDMFRCSKELFSLFDKEPTTYSQLNAWERAQWDEAEQRLIARGEPLENWSFPDRSLLEILRKCHAALGETALGERRFEGVRQSLDQASGELKQLETRLKDTTRPMLKVRLSERKAELQDLSIALRLSSGQVNSPEEFGDLVTGNRRSRLWGQEPWKALAAAIETWYLADDEILFSAAVNALVNSNDPSVDAAMKSRAAQLQTRFWVLHRPKDESKVQPIFDALANRISVDPVALAFCIEWTLNATGGIGSSEQPAQLPQESQKQWQPKADSLAKFTAPHEPRFAGFPDYVLGQWYCATGSVRNAGVHTLRASEPLLAERYWSFPHAGRCLFPPKSTEPLSDPSSHAMASGGSTTMVDVPGWIDEERRGATLFALNLAAEDAGLPTNKHFKRSDEPLEDSESARKYILRAANLQKNATSPKTDSNLLRVRLVQFWPMETTPHAIKEGPLDTSEIATRPDLEAAAKDDIDIPVKLGYGVLRARQYRTTHDDQCRKDAVAAFQECLRKVFKFGRKAQGVSDLAVYQRLVNNAVQEIEGWKADLSQLPSEEKSQIAFIFAAKGRLLQRTPEIDDGTESEIISKACDAFRHSLDLDPQIEYRVGLARSLYDLCENRGSGDYQEFVSAAVGLRQDGEAVKTNAGALGVLGLADFVSARSCQDLSEKVQYLKSSVKNTEQALDVVKPDPEQADEFEAVSLETASKAYHELAFNEPVTFVEADESEPKTEGNTAWNYYMAVRYATKATEVENRRDPEDAFVCCGNALEDQALYLCRIDRYEAAIAQFVKAEEASRSRLHPRPKPLMYLGRCRFRYATAINAKTRTLALQSSPRMFQLKKGIDNLEKALQIWGKKESPDVAETHYWLARTCEELAKFASGEDKKGFTQDDIHQFQDKADKSYREACRLSRFTQSPTLAMACRKRILQTTPDKEKEIDCLLEGELSNDPTMFVSFLADIFRMIPPNKRNQLVEKARSLFDGKQPPFTTELQLDFLQAQIVLSVESEESSKFKDIVSKLDKDLTHVEENIKDPAEKLRWQDKLHSKLFEAAILIRESRHEPLTDQDLDHGFRALEAQTNGLDAIVQRELRELSKRDVNQTERRKNWPACVTMQIERHLNDSFDLRKSLLRASNGTSKLENAVEQVRPLLVLDAPEPPPDQDSDPHSEKEKPTRRTQRLEDLKELRTFLDQLPPAGKSN